MGVQDGQLMQNEHRAPLLMCHALSENGSCHGRCRTVEVKALSEYFLTCHLPSFLAQICGHLGAP